jgi:dinuclear metal center YbgI/SA1388 family protein
VTATFADVLEALERLYPLVLAEPWDNVGLLVPPPAGLEGRCRRVLVTIDLGEEVLDEACSAQADMVIAYHPPMFKARKRFDLALAEDRVLLRAIRAGIAIASPHTAVDAAAAGVNDWLADALGAGRRRPIVPARAAPGAPMLPDVTGHGRHVELDPPSPFEVLVTRIKQHLDLRHVRVAASARHEAGEPVRTAAVCAGAGGSLFEQVGAIDLLWTGEMRHHDVLARVAAGTSVVLCDHSNTERGYLVRMAARLAGAVPELDVAVSSRDREPLVIV